MKKIKKFVAALTVVATLVLLTETDVSTVHADEPVTYTVKYVSDEIGWRYQKDSSELASGIGSNIYYLTQEIKDGDIVVIYNNIGTNTPLDLGNVHLSNLTFVQGTKPSVVSAGSIKDCYVLAGTTGAVNSDVENAYVYDYAIFNFNGNVGELTINSNDYVQSRIGTEGTVDHLYAYSSTLSRVLMDYYDFSAGSLYLKDGVFSPRGSYRTAEEHAADPTTKGTSSSDEYDDVPKTGQSNLYLWLLFASVVCFAGSRALKRSAE